MGGLGLTSQTLRSSQREPLYLCLLCLLYWCPIPLLRPRVNFTFWEQSCPIDPYLEWLGVAGKVQGQGLEHGLVRRRTQCYCVGGFSPYPAPYTQFVPFFGHLVKCRAGGRPRQWLSSAWAVDPKINWAWARATISLTPQ